MPVFDTSILDEIEAAIESSPPNKALVTASLTRRRMAALSALSRRHFDICPISSLEPGSLRDDPFAMVREFLDGVHCEDFDEMSPRGRRTVWAATLWYLGLPAPHLAPADQSVPYPDHLRKLDDQNAEKDEPKEHRASRCPMIRSKEPHTMVLGLVFVAVVIGFALGRLTGSQAPAPRPMPGPPVLTSPTPAPPPPQHSLYTPQSNQHAPKP